MDLTACLMALIRSEITGEEPDPIQFKDLCAEDWKRILDLAAGHDAAHLIADAAIRNRLVQAEDLTERLQKQIIAAVFRFQRSENDLNALKKELEKANVPFLPLKGAVLRHFYPEPWMRTSCDLDILIHEADLERTRKILAEELQYAIGKKGSHNLDAISPSGVHLELHFCLYDVNFPRQFDVPLKNVWQYVLADAPLRLSNEMFYYYHIMHMAKHFENGGCGIRPFADLWLMKQYLTVDSSVKDRLLAEGGLCSFAAQAECLASVWFGGTNHSSTTKKMEDYVLSGRLYGSFDSQIAVYQTKKGGKLGYLWYRLWLPYEALCVVYPFLRGKRILQPFFEIRRWGRIFRKDVFDRSKREIRTGFSVSDEKRAQTAQLLSELGLMR